MLFPLHVRKSVQHASDGDITFAAQ